MRCLTSSRTQISSRLTATAATRTAASPAPGDRVGSVGQLHGVRTAVLGQDDRAHLLLAGERAAGRSG